jgi:hypothetical protein
VIAFHTKTYPGEVTSAKDFTRCSFSVTVAEDGSHDNAQLEDESLSSMSGDGSYSALCVGLVVSNNNELMTAIRN